MRSWLILRKKYNATHVQDRIQQTELFLPKWTAAAAKQCTDPLIYKLKLKSYTIYMSRQTTTYRVGLHLESTKIASLFVLLQNLNSFSIRIKNKTQMWLIAAVCRARCNTTFSKMQQQQQQQQQNNAIKYPKIREMT